MAKGIYGCFISLLLSLGTVLQAQDTVMVPLHIRAGFDFGGLAGTMLNSSHLSYGVAGSADLSELMAVTATARYTSFSANESTYDYSSKGLSFTIGPDFNLLKPTTAKGAHYIGAGIHYGLSFYSHQAPRIEYTNPWGTVATTMPESSHLGHYLELTPGVRTELFPWLTVGWNISLRLLLSDGTTSHFKPVHMPGYGNAASRTTAGAYYYISISIPYKTKRVITRPKAQTEEEEPEAESGESSENSY